ncbi:hypothetical protein LLH03_21670, partial [bacterium]|nr:hypothetical protein [bacterium]
LRFWWRAMHPELVEEDLFDAEAAIFGSTSYKRGKDTKGGQGLRVVPAGGEWQRETLAPYGPNKQSPLFYMVYGADGRRKEGDCWVGDPRIKAGGTFRFRLVASRLTSQQWAEVLGALWLLSAFGGFGRRNRRGFGSLQLQGVPHAVPASPEPQGQVTLPDLAACEDAEALAVALEQGLRTLGVPRPATPPLHTAFSSETKIAAGSASDSGWEQTLRQAGHLFYDYRRLLGTVFRHTENDKPMGDDLQLTQGYLGSGVGTPAPPATKGVVFGAPHNYQFSSTGEKAFYEVFGPGDPVGPKDHGQQRRASPLIFKVLKLNNGKHVPLVVWLPSLFLPDDYDLKFTRGPKTALVHSDVAKPDAAAMQAAAAPLFAPAAVSVSGKDNAGVVVTTTFKGYVASGWTVIL